MLDKLFGSKLRARVVGWLFCHPDERFFVRQMESILGEDATNLSRELARLAEIGMLICESDGREKYYQANTECPIFPELQGLAVKTVGVADVLKSALAPIAERIDLAFIYGSFARGEQRLGSDIDLLTVGDMSFGDVVSALADAQKSLCREVNPTAYPRVEFRQKLAAGHHFLKSVLDGPKIFLIGDERELAGLVEEPLAD